jgi:hypothetical protein
MVKKIFANSGKFWNWLVQSSVDPQAVALSVQGFFSLAVVQTAFSLLPVIGIHPTFTLAVLGSGVSSAVYSVLMIVSYAVTLWGLLRKAIVTIHNLVPAPAPVVRDGGSSPTVLASTPQTK